MKITAEDITKQKEEMAAIKEKARKLLAQLQNESIDNMFLIAGFVYMDAMLKSIIASGEKEFGKILRLMEENGKPEVTEEIGRKIALEQASEKARILALLWFIQNTEMAK